MLQIINIISLDQKIEDITNLYGKFKLSPLKKGQGITIGNSLRRTLLSEIKGIEIKAIKISMDDRSLFPKIHEFSSIPGIKESILEILLNIKNIVISVDTKKENQEFSSTETLFKIKVKGPTRITAKNIKLPNNLKLINPNQYIATLNSNENLEILFFIQQDKNKLIENDSDKIEIDYSFTPIKKVNYMCDYN